MNAVVAGPRWIYCCSIVFLITSDDLRVAVRSCMIRGRGDDCEEREPFVLHMFPAARTDATDPNNYQRDSIWT